MTRTDRCLSALVRSAIPPRGHHRRWLIGVRFSGASGVIGSVAPRPEHVGLDREDGRSAAPLEVVTGRGHEVESACARVSVSGDAFVDGTGCALEELDSFTAEHDALRHGQVRDCGEEPPEHRCGKCYGPYGKSSIRCVNEPPLRTAAEQLLHDIFESTEGE